MKLLSLTAAAAALLVAAPAQAYPQWLPVSTDAEMQINYNSVRVSDEGVRSVDVSIPNLPVLPIYISCEAWQYKFSDIPWKGMAPGSVPETVAYIICPGAEKQRAIKHVQALKVGVPAAPAVAADDGMVHMNGKSYQTVGEAMCDPAFYNVLINNCPNRY